MQLRSGKNIQTVSGKASCAYGDQSQLYERSHPENITMRIKPLSSKDKPKSKPITYMSTHSMSLRSKQSSASTHEQDTVRLASNQSPPVNDLSSGLKVHTNQHNSTQGRHTTHLDINHWLVGRLKGFMADFNKVKGDTYEERILEKCQLFVEMTAVMYEHIDYITSTRGFVQFSHTLCKKLHEFKTELTLLLNCVNLCGSGYTCNFTPDERIFIGNARADFVKLMVITGNRLPSVSLY